MQARLRDPYDALGVSGSSTPADIRSAFFALTKRFHPARFCRMPPDIQRLANEVFLGLRAAHDALARPTIKPVRQSQGTPVVQRPGSQPPGGPSGAAQPPAISRTSSPQMPVISRTQTPAISRPSSASGVPIQPQPRGGTGPVAAIPRPPGAPHPPSQPAPYQPRTRTEPGSAPGRAPGPSPDDRGLHATAKPATAPATTPAAPGRPGGDDNKELATAIELLGKSQWEPARTILNALAARSPQIARYRALLAYSRGREAQLLRRIDEARVELDQALQIDPELQLAKTALGELFTRRK